MRKYFEFYNGAKIKCGDSALLTIGSELASLGCKKPLLLSSQNMEKLGVVDKVSVAISKESAEEIVTCTSVPQKFEADAVKEIEKAYRDAGCDGIVAVGADGVMDTAKCLRLFLSQNCDEIIPIMGTSVRRPSSVPLIVIPTENGSGREASGCLEVSDSFLSAEAIVPDVVIIDEDTAMAAPARVVAACGAYALANAVEAYIATEEADPAEIYAEKAIKLLYKHLINTVKDGDNEVSCRATALAATYAGIAYGNHPFGAAHALAEGMAEISGEPVAEMLAMTLVPAMIRARENYIDRLKGLLLITAGPVEYAETPDSERADKAIETIEKLLEELSEVSHVATKISKTKIMRETFGAIAEAAANKRSAITEFSPIGRDEFIILLNNAY